MAFQENLIDIVNKMTPQEHYDLLLEFLRYPLPQGLSLHKCMKCGIVGWVNGKTHSSSSHFDKNNIGSLILYCNNCIGNCTENGQKNNGIEKKELKSVIPIRIFSTDGDIEFDSEKDLEQWNEKYKGSEYENFSRSMSSDLISKEINSEREIVSDFDEELETEEELDRDSDKDLDKWIEEKREKRRSIEKEFIKRIKSEDEIYKENINKNITTEEIDESESKDTIEMKNLIKEKIKTRILKKIIDKKPLSNSPINDLFYVTCRIDKIGRYLKKYNGMFIPMHSCEKCHGGHFLNKCEIHALVSSIEKIIKNIREYNVNYFNDKLKDLDANLNRMTKFHEKLVEDIKKIF